jgi:hypothetical protein
MAKSDFHSIPGVQIGAAAVTFLQRYRDGRGFLNKIVTGDETWFHYVNKSKHWVHSRTPNKPKEFNQTFSIRNPMATVFWD